MIDELLFAANSVDITRKLLRFLGRNDCGWVFGRMIKGLELGERLAGGWEVIEKYKIRFVGADYSIDFWLESGRQFVKYYGLSKCKRLPQRLGVWYWTMNSETPVRINGGMVVPLRILYGVVGMNVAGAQRISGVLLDAHELGEL